MTDAESAILAVLVVLLEWQRQATGRTGLQMWGWAIGALIAVQAGSALNHLALAYIRGFIGGGQ